MEMELGLRQREEDAPPLGVVGREVQSSHGPMLRSPAMSRGRRAMSGVRRASLTIAWLLIVAVVSVGGAGIVAAMANPPGTASRAELTMDGDAAANAALDKALTELQTLTGQVERLGELG